MPLSPLPARLLHAAAALACLWAAGRAVPAQAGDLATPLPDVRPGEVAVQLDATGAVSARLAQQAPADDTHLCATLTLPGGRQDYLLRFGADPAASVLDPARPALVLTVAGLDGAAPAQTGPRDGSVQVAIGGQTFFGSTQPGAPFRLEVTLLPGQDGGRIHARHLTDRSGQQVIDLDGAWRCATSPTAVATAAAPAPDPDPAPAASPPTGLASTSPALAIPATPAATPIAPAPEPIVTAAEPTPPAPNAPAPNAPALNVPSPSVPAVDAPAVDAPAAPALPPATAFRRLLTELDQAAPPGRMAPAPPPPAPPGVAAPPDAPRARVLQAPPGVVAPPPGVAVANPEFSRRRVFIHYRGGSRRGAAVADDLARTLDPQFARTEIRPVAATPATAEIRYSHPEDAAAADALARRLGGANSPWHVRAFTELASRTAPGSLEVWVPER